MRKQARIKRKEKVDKGVYYECFDCDKRFKVKVCPLCGKKLKGAYCESMASITNCSSNLFGEDGDV